MMAAPPKEIADALPPPTAGSIGLYRRWFDFRYIEVYIRLNHRYICGQVVRTLELSNVSVDETERGQGRFTRLLDGLMTLAKKRGEVLLVENVVNEIARGALLRRGFIDYEGRKANYVKLDF
jgi:GNAT superfamily N-acetyltransferase